MKAVDRIQETILALAALLFLTGGYRHKLEISQIDLFGWVFLGLVVLRLALSGSAVGRRLDKVADRARCLIASKPTRVLVLGTAACAACYFAIGALRFESFHGDAFDLGFVDQSIWNTAFPDGNPGWFLRSTLSRGGTYLGEHFAPLLAVFAPLYRIAATPYWLFLARSALISSGAIFLFALGRMEGLAAPTCLLLSACYLLYSPIQGAFLFDFREDAFFVPLVFGAIVAARARRWGWLAACAALSWLAKENGGLATGLIGGALLVTGETYVGALLCGASLACFAYVNSSLMPRFSGAANQTILAARVGELGGDNAEILRNLMLHPIRSALLIAGSKFHPRTLFYVFKVALPALPLFVVKKAFFSAWPFLACAAVLLIANLLVTPQVVGFHYELVIAPFLFAGIARGYKPLAIAWGTRNAAWIMLALALCFAGRGPLLYIRESWPTAETGCLWRVFSRIPPEASVAAQSGLYPALDHRPEASLLADPERIREDLVILSQLDVGSFGLRDRGETIQALRGKGYQRVIAGKWAEVWCRPDACARWGSLGRDLAAVGCR